MRVHIHRLSFEEFFREVLREGNLLAEELFIFCELLFGGVRYWLDLINSLDDHDIARNLRLFINKINTKSSDDILAQLLLR
jgi:hypothetical protein